MKISEISFCGMLVGFCVSFIVCPIEYAKIIRQTQSDMKRGSFLFMLEDIKKNGLKNIYRGLTPTILKESFGSIAYFGLYEKTVRKMC